jgi:hypothetical protein
MQSLMTCCDLFEELRMPTAGNAPRGKAVSQEGLVLGPTAENVHPDVVLRDVIIAGDSATSSWHSVLSLATSSAAGSSSSLTWNLHSGLFRSCFLAFGFAVHFGQGTELPELDMAGLVAGKLDMAGLVAELHCFMRRAFGVFFLNPLLEMEPRGDVVYGRPDHITSDAATFFL